MKMNGSKIGFKNNYDIVYYGKSDDVSPNENKEESKSTLNKLISTKETLNSHYVYHITSHRSILDELIKKNNEALAMFNLKEQFHSICSSMNIKNTKPIYEMLLTIVKDQTFGQFQFNELKNIIGALYYIYKVKRCSYKYTQASIISIMKNRELNEEMFEYYIETFSKVLKVDEISEEEVKYGVKKVFNKVMEYLTTNKNKIDFKIEDVYDLYDITDEKDSNEIIEYNNYKLNEREKIVSDEDDNKDVSKWYDNKDNNEYNNKYKVKYNNKFGDNDKYEDRENNYSEYKTNDKYTNKEYNGDDNFGYENSYEDSDDNSNEDGDVEDENDDGEYENNDSEYENNDEDDDSDVNDNNDDRCWIGYVSHKVKIEDEGRNSKVSLEERRIGEELKRLLISKIESHYEDIIVTALKMFEIIKCNELNKEMTESGRMSGIKYRKLMIPTIIFITASSYEVEMMGRYIAEGLNLKHEELIYSSKLMVEWLKNVLIKRYRYKIYNAKLFLQVVRSLKNNKRKVNEVYKEYNKEENENINEEDKDGNGLSNVGINGLSKVDMKGLSKVGINGLRLWEIICNNGIKVPKKLINERIDILLNYIIQNLSEEMKRVTLNKDGMKIWFTKKEVIQYYEVMGDMSILYKKKKYDEFRRQVRISQSYHQLIYKLVLLNRKNIETTSMELIKIADENGFMEMKSEMKLSNYAINKHMVNSIVLITIRLLKIPISSRMMFLYVKRPEGSFYISMKKIMRIMAKIIEKRQKCRVSTMEEFLGRIAKENDIEKMIIKTETLLKLVKDEKGVKEEIEN